MSGINYSQMTVTPYEYWDLRLRHFQLVQQDERVAEDLYDSIKQTLIADLCEFLTEQEEDRSEDIPF